MAVAILFVRFRATDAGRRRIDNWKMNAPIVGKVVKLNLFGQFARTLSTLLENGVPVLTALKITEHVIPNVILKEALAKTRGTRRYAQKCDHCAGYEDQACISACPPARRRLLMTTSWSLKGASVCSVCDSSH